MDINVLIAGAGQLGSRYLQGLSYLSVKLNIWVYDISPNSLLIAKNRWEERSSFNKVNYINKLEINSKNIDIVFVTTTADVRLQVVKEIVKKFYVKFWILEKVLLQNVSGLKILDQLIVNNAWVNTPLYIWPIYKELRDRAKTSGPITAFFQVHGLACNAIHYIDFVSRWNGSRVIGANLNELSNTWIPSKRKGFMEIEGSIDFLFSDGSRLYLNNKYENTIKTKNEVWKVDEVLGVYKDNSGKKFKSSILKQSQMTSLLVNDILKNETCDLPCLKESIIQHKFLLKMLIKHRNHHMPKKIKNLPIT